MAPVSFSGRTAIVTGAGAGLGRAYALAFGEHGANVVVNDIAADRAEATVEAITAAGGRAVASAHDVSDSAQADDLVGVALSTYDGLDVVVNNAGILHDADLTAITDDDWRRVLAVNVDGAFFLTRAAWPALLASSTPRVVFVTSASGLFGNIGHAHYSTSKGAVVALMKAVALEGRDYGILSNAIAPLAVSAQSLAPTAGVSRRVSARDIIGDPFDGFDPAYVATAVLALSHSDHTGSGEVISVGGGLVRTVSTAVSQGIYDPELDAAALEQRWSELTGDGMTMPTDLQQDTAEVGRRVRAGAGALDDHGRVSE